MASGHVYRARRPNTWPLRPPPQSEDSPCQPGAVHTWPFASFRGDAVLRSLSDRSGHQMAGRPTGSVEFDPKRNPVAMFCRTILC